MNYGKYDTICCKRCFYLVVCNELSSIDPGNQLLIITNTMNINTILQSSNLNVFMHRYILHCEFDHFYKILENYFFLFMAKFSRLSPYFMSEVNDFKI